MPCAHIQSEMVKPLSHVVGAPHKCCSSLLLLTQRDSYCSLIGLTSSNLHQQHQPHSLTHIKQSNNRGKTINLGIKQFDMVRNRIFSIK